MTPHLAAALLRWWFLSEIRQIYVNGALLLHFHLFYVNQLIQLFCRYHMRTFDKVATCHYIRGSQMFHTNLIKAPALFILSETDPIGAVSSNLRAKESWENMGIEVFRI